jgi:membrane-bound lytic murein transglycosylase MltF
VGLMQLMPAAAERFGCHDRNDPAENIAAGTRRLQRR